MLLWKVFRVKQEIFFLLLCFFAFPLITWWIVYQMRIWTDLEAAAVLAFTMALSMGYPATYPAIKRENPTFEILFMLKNSGARGLSRDEIMKEMCRGSDLFEAKVDELRSDIFVNYKNNQFRLTRLGALAAVFFSFYRKLLGLERGPG